jgi:single-strand DNA-binding protein
MALPNLSGEARLIDDPELRFTSSGKGVARLRLAFNSRKQVNGQWIDGDTLFLDGTVWDKAAENAAQSLSKGDLVVVTGRPKTATWETRDGEKRSRVELMIDSVAPSLRYAEAKVTLVERSRPAGPPDDDPWATATPVSRGGSDEPPF